MIILSSVYCIRDPFKSAVLVPLGVHEKLTGGTPNFKNHSKPVYLGRIFDLGIRDRVQFFIWGYAEWCNPDQGVRNYQKVENP